MLELNKLSINYKMREGTVHAVDSIDLTVEEGEILGVVGESGCGKTTTIKSILGLLDSNGVISEGTIEYKNRDISEMTESQLRSEIRWKEIAMIAQSAMASLDPVYTIGSQFVEVIRTHTDKSKSEAREKTKQLLSSVDIEPNRIKDYPHELSGGQRQRVVIALSLALEPSLIIADEPTTGLDVIVQDQILELIKDIQEDFDCSIILVTHDMSVVAEVADRVAVMYGGRLMEIGPVSEVMNDSSHPYTIGLKNSFPTLERGANMADLITIPGNPPNLSSPPSGCRFQQRCPYSTETCINVEPQSHELEVGHRIKCHYPDDVEEMQTEGRRATTWKNKQETHND
jgi:oligopeptide/dipeptide ABC transporter ATP-binding protein